VKISKIFIYSLHNPTMLYKTKRRLIIGISLVLLIILYIFKNTSVLIRVLSVIFGLWIFYFLDHAFNINFLPRHYIYITAVLVFGILLSPFYWVSESYDKILHFAMPILGSIMVFYMINKLKIELKWKILLTLTTILSLLVILEIGEYLFDVFFDLKLQGVYLRDISGFEKLNLVMDKNDDTMMDLILGLIGSTLFSFSKYIIHTIQKRKLTVLRRF